MDADAIVMHEVDRDRMAVVRGLFAAPVARSPEPRHRHAHREVLALNIAGRDMARIGFAGAAKRWQRARRQHRLKPQRLASHWRREYYRPAPQCPADHPLPSLSSLARLNDKHWARSAGVHKSKCPGFRGSTGVFGGAPSVRFETASSNSA
jgi:hypothetical protein